MMEVILTHLVHTAKEVKSCHVQLERVNLYYFYDRAKHSLPSRTKVVDFYICLVFDVEDSAIDGSLSMPLEG